MPERANRTFICSVVFFDIAEYSKKPVSEQISLKDRFNALLSEALQDAPAQDRVILDTGDGAAISFMGDPEDALFVAVRFRDALATKAAATQARPEPAPPLLVRIGINLGPVKLVKDINGQPNIIGDGINVAQRIMSFAEIGQVLISRPYHDVVARLSEEYGQLFSYLGTRTDKHVREHEVFTVGANAGTGGFDIRTRKIARFEPADDATRAAATTPTAARFSAHHKLLIWAPLTVAAVLLLGMALRGQRGAPDTISSKQELSALAQPGANKSATAKSEAQMPAAPAAGKFGKPLPTELAHISLVVVPWGEVYVDGKMLGISPPLKSVEVKPGSHKIEIKNTAFPPHTETVFVQARERVKINHRFNK